MSLEDDIKLLSRVRLFAGFEHDHLRLLAFGAEALVFGEGSWLYRQDDLSDGGYVICRGSVDLISNYKNQIIASHNQGALLGELALITETHNAASAYVSKDAEVLRIPRPLFLRMLNEYPQLAQLLQGRIVESVDEFNKRLEVIRAKLDHATDLATRKSKKAAG